MYVRLFMACLLPLCISACSKPSSHSESATENTAQRSERITETAPASPIVIDGKQIAAPAASDALNESLLIDFQKYLTEESSTRHSVLGLRQELKLQPNQILLFGVRGKDRTEFPVVDLSQTALYQRAGDLAVDHIRWLKRSPIPEKDMYETTAEYQQRIAAIQHKHQQLTANSTIDLQRIEDALNYTNRWISIPASWDRLNRIDYDADQALLTIRTTAPEWRDSELHYLSQGQNIRQLYFQLEANVEQAKQVMDAFQSRQQSPVYLAFVLNYQATGIAIDRIVLMEYFDIGVLRPIVQLRPKQITFQDLAQDLTLQHQATVQLQQWIPYRFTITPQVKPVNPVRHDPNETIAADQILTEEDVAIALNNASSHNQQAVTDPDVEGGE